VQAALAARDQFETGRCQRRRTLDRAVGEQDL
jgi:hypothetical protein